VAKEIHDLRASARSTAILVETASSDSASTIGVGVPDLLLHRPARSNLSPTVLAS
jgi:hypothetical protein